MSLWEKRPVISLLWRPAFEPKCFSHVIIQVLVSIKKSQLKFTKNSILKARNLKIKLEILTQEDTRVKTVHIRSVFSFVYSSGCVIFKCCQPFSLWLFFWVLKWIRDIQVLRFTTTFLWLKEAQYVSKGPTLLIRTICSITKHCNMWSFIYNSLFEKSSSVDKRTLWFFFKLY